MEAENLELTQLYQFVIILFNGTNIMCIIDTQRSVLIDKLLNIYVFSKQISQERK